MAEKTANELAIQALEAWEQWEADIILDREVWREGELRGHCLPTLTQELWDRVIGLQELRNAALAKARGEDQS